MTTAHHFNGLPYVADVPVYATAAVRDVVAAVAEPKRDQWQPTYGKEWPDTYRVPDHPLTDGSTVEVGGLSITVHGRFLPQAPLSWMIGLGADAVAAELAAETGAAA